MSPRRSGRVCEPSSWNSSFTFEVCHTCWNPPVTVAERCLAVSRMLSDQLPGWAFAQVEELLKARAHIDRAGIVMVELRQVRDVTGVGTAS